MTCECDYCIYNKDSTCQLEETSLNSAAYCNECILVALTDDELAALKKRHLREIEIRWETQPDRQ